MRSLIFLLLFSSQAFGAYEEQIVSADDFENIVKNFGTSIDIYNDTAVVGSFGGSTSFVATYKRVNNIWNKQYQLIPSDHNPYVGDEIGYGFGLSMSLENNTLLVGARSDADYVTQGGAVYAFTRSDETWTEVQKFTSDDLAPNDNFGSDISISGDTAIIGVRPGYPLDLAGYAYIFSKNDGVWSQQQKITSSDAQIGSRFGEQVAISGDTIVISAFSANNQNGVVYIFTQNNGIWTEQQKLTASDSQNIRHFGKSVSIHNDTIVIGQTWPYENEYPSSAYVFKKENENWVEHQKLIPSDSTNETGVRLIFPQ